MSTTAPKRSQAIRWAATITALAAAPVLLVTPSAQADANVKGSSCSPMFSNSKVFYASTIGGKVPIKVYVRMCVEKTGNGHKAAALVGAVGDTGGDLSGPPLFDKFEVAVALNKNGNAGLKAYCNIAYDLNRMQNLPQYCDTSVDGSSSRGGWSGGGYVKYRLHNQGESYWGGINDSPTID